MNDTETTYEQDENPYFQESEVPERYAVIIYSVN